MIFFVLSYLPPPAESLAPLPPELVEVVLLVGVQRLLQLAPHAGRAHGDGGDGVADEGQRAVVVALLLLRPDRDDHPPLLPLPELEDSSCAHVRAWLHFYGRVVSVLAQLLHLYVQLQLAGQLGPSEDRTKEQVVLRLGFMLVK